MIKVIYDGIKQVIPYTTDFENFNPGNPFSVYGIDSLSTIKLTNILSRKLNRRFSPVILFNHGNTFDLAKYITGNLDLKKGMKMLTEHQNYNETIPQMLNEDSHMEKIMIHLILTKKLLSLVWVFVYLVLLIMLDPYGWP